ncbi:MAG: hypothetical protein JW940_16755 [Polyangiaceae bacterium]|nr:hypothetical protein [Polyangiaceae bacterium]
MNVPRLLDCLEDERARRMLSSWAEEEPPPATLHKTAAALGLAAATVMVTGTSATAATLGPGAAAATGAAANAGVGTVGTGLASTAAMAAKWIGAGIVGGALAVGTAHYASSPVRHPSSAPRAASSVSRTTWARTGSQSSRRQRGPEANVEPASESPAADSVSATPPHAVVALRPSVVPAQTAARPSAESAPTLRYSESMEAELALIDQARQQLSQGDPNAALDTLRRYDAECTTAVLAREATVLRVQALFGAGRTADAVSLGRRFVAEHPDSPHAANLRRLLGRQPTVEQ